MNRSNHQIPPNLHSCCCCCSSRGHGTKYHESSPLESNGTKEDFHNAFSCNTLTTSNNQPFAHEDLYENLLELLDDQMMNTMSCLRKRARKIIKSELENFNSEVTSRPCTCPEEVHCRGANITERANEIDYQPQSNFLQKMVHHYRDWKNDCTDEKDSPTQQSGARKKSAKSKKKGSRTGKTVRSGEFSPKSPDWQRKRKQTTKKSEHISRPKTLTKTRGKRKRVSVDKSDSGFENTLKTPHENSCERCWRFASPPRSPVNKPDQRYDPNFRRGHSCEHLGKPEELIDERGNHISPCKNLQPLDTTTKTDRATFSPQYPLPKKSAQSDFRPSRNYAPHYTPFTGQAGTSPGVGTPSKYQFQNPMAYARVKQLAFEWPMQKSPTAPSQIEQIIRQNRPHTSEKSRLTDSTETGARHSTARNRTRRPKTYSPCVNREDSWGDYVNILDTTEYKDICGVKLQEALDPCLNRNNLARRGGAPYHDQEMRGDGSKEKVLDGGMVGLSPGRSSRDDKEALDSTGGRNGRVSGEIEESRDDTGSRLSKEGMASAHRDGRGGADGKNGAVRRKGADRKKGTDGRGGVDKRNYVDDRDGRDNGVGGAVAVNFSKEAINIKSGEFTAETRKTENLEKPDNIGKTSPAYATPGGTDKFAPFTREKPKSYSVPKPYLKSKPPPVMKSPKSKSPPKTPRESPRRTKDKKGTEATRGEKSQPPPSQYEVTPYFKLPEKGTRPHYDTSSAITSDLDSSAMLHPIRECQCYPRTVPDNGKDCLCCHCNWNEYDSIEPRTYLDRVDTLGVGGRCTPAPPPPSAREPQITQSPRACPPCRGPLLPNLSEYPEQMYDRRALGANYMENAIPCPYKRFTNLCAENGAVRNSPRYQTGNENISCGNNPQASSMNGGMTFQSDFPRKYCVYYMTKGKENKADDVEVLIEELCQSCPRDEKVMNVCEKMKRVAKCQNESMALKFQKGVSECCKPPEKTRVLYF